jgi:hypothetical protein
LAGEDQHGIHVFTFRQAAKSIHRIAGEVSCSDLGTMSHRFTHGTDFKTVTQSAKRRTMSDFPSISDTNQADA